MKSKALFFLALPALYGSAGCSSSSPRAIAETSEPVQFVLPEEQATVNGIIDVAVAIDLDEPIQAARFGAREQDMFDMRTPGTFFHFDTTQLENGPQTLRMQVQGESGTVWSDTLNITVDNPTHQLLEVSANQRSYRNGEEVTLTLQYSEADLLLDGDFSELDSGFYGGATRFVDRGSGLYELTYTISEENLISPGEYEVRIVASNAAGKPLTTKYRIRLDALPSIPLDIEGGVFIDRAAPSHAAASPSSSSILQSVTGPSVLLTGDEGTLQLTWQPDATRQPNRLLVAAADRQGYYVVPVQGTAISVPVTVPSRAPGVEGGELELDLSLLDAEGAIVGADTLSLKTVPLDSRGATVTLTWDSEADLDLSVEEPGGSTVSYDTPLTTSGGTFDLDANALCESSNASAERISWPLGAEPAGNYTPHVSIYSACVGGKTNYTLTVRACGRTQTHRGTFESSDAEDSSTSSRDLPSFSVDCAERVHGKIEFQKGQLTRTREPAAFVPVRAVTGSGANKAVLKESVTRADGTYELLLGATPSSYQIEVESTWAPTAGADPLVRVIDLSTARPHVFTRTAQTTDGEPAKPKDLLVTVEKGSGALNILSNARKVFEWTMAEWGTPPPSLPLRWTRGFSPPEGGSYYWESSVWIEGVRGSPDEFDDSVVVHETNHHVMAKMSLDQSPGGTHFAEGYSNPALAWSEGVATGLGQHALNHPIYADTIANGSAVLYIDIESNPNIGNDVGKTAIGTQSGKMTGALNEFMVAMVVWDLLDPAGEPHDHVSGADKQVSDSLFRYLPARSRKNRGATGVDLVDFLDGWRCAFGKSTDAQLRPILEERRFPYDFAALNQCLP